MGRERGHEVGVKGFSDDKQGFFSKYRDTVLHYSGPHEGTSCKRSGDVKLQTF